MEGIGIKNIMVVMMMLFLVMVQADHSPSYPSDSKGRHCILKCGASCLLKLKITPVRYMPCFNLCMVGCRISPSDVVYNCTQDCAQSKTVNSESGMRISNPNFSPHFPLLFISNTCYLKNKHRFNVLNCCFSL